MVRAKVGRRLRRAPSWRKRRSRVPGFLRGTAAALARVVRSLPGMRSPSRVLYAMVAASIVLHAMIFAVVCGLRLGQDGGPRAAGLVSEEVLIDLVPARPSLAVPLRRQQLPPPPAPAVPKFQPPAGNPINVLTAPVADVLHGLPSGGQDLKAVMLGLGGARDGFGGVGAARLGIGTNPRSFALGGGTVRASALIVLLDASGSMQEDNKMERARKKILDLSKQTGIRVMAQIEVPNCAFVQIAEPGANPELPTDAAYAMSAAMRRFPFADAIYFFSDFQDLVAPTTVEQLRLIATEIEPKVRVYLHTLEQNPDEALAGLCRATGGQILK